MKTFFVGVKGFIRDERGILLIRHNEGHWDVPGGRMDGNETFEDTLAREIAEEIPGAALTSVNELKGALRLQKDIQGDVSLILLYFLVEARLPKHIRIGDEHSSISWINYRGDIPTEHLNPKIAEILRELLT